MTKNLHGSFDELSCHGTDAVTEVRCRERLLKVDGKLVTGYDTISQAGRLIKGKLYSDVSGRKGSRV